MTEMLSERQKNELLTRGISVAAIEALDSELVNLSAYIHGERAVLNRENGSLRLESAENTPPSNRKRAANLEALADLLSDAAKLIAMADNVALARLQAHSTGAYPKTTLSAHELITAISSYARGAKEAADDLAGRGPARGPDATFTMHIAARVLVVLTAYGIPATSTENKILETAIDACFSALKIKRGTGAEYARKITRTPTQAQK